jgi:AP-1 complex subunit mu
MELDVTMKALFRSKTTSNEVELHIPIPSDAFNPDFNCEAGVVSYYPDEDCIIWQIPTFVGEEEMRMKTRMSLPTVVSCNLIF